MNIQGSFNQALSVASLLFSQSSKVAEIKEQRRIAGIHEDYERRANIIREERSAEALTPRIVAEGMGRAPIEALEIEATQAEELADLYGAEFRATGSAEAYRKASQYKKEFEARSGEISGIREQQQRRAESDRISAEQIERDRQTSNRIRENILRGGI